MVLALFVHASNYLGDMNNSDLMNSLPILKNKAAN